MTDWSALSDACGSAEHVPALLDRFEAAPSEVWSELLDHLCPQLEMAFLASFAALPRLARLATRLDPQQRAWVLSAAGAIVSCAPSPSGADGDVFQVYCAPIAELHSLTDGCLRDTRDLQDYVYMLQDLLSFEGVEIWDRSLTGLVSGEYEVACPYCGVEVFIVITDTGHFSASDDYALRQVEQEPLRPTRPDDLTGLARRLHDRVLADRHERVADGLLYLFGQAICPDCRTAFSVADRIAAKWSPA